MTEAARENEHLQKSIPHCSSSKPSLSKQLQDRTISSSLHLSTMHLVIYLLSLLLVALSTDGLGLPPGRWCGTKPCDARMEDSRINVRAVSNTTASDTAVNRTAVNSTAVNKTTVNNTAGITAPMGESPTESCFWSCRATKRQINKTNTSQKASTKRQIDLAASEAFESS